MILSYDMILENLPRTSRQTHKQTNRQRIQLQRPLLSPVDRRGERANCVNRMNDAEEMMKMIELWGDSEQIDTEYDEDETSEGDKEDTDEEETSKGEGDKKGTEEEGQTNKEGDDDKENEEGLEGSEDKNDEVEKNNEEGKETVENKNDNGNDSERENKEKGENSSKYDEKEDGAFSMLDALLNEKDAQNNTEKNKASKAIVGIPVNSDGPTSNEKQVKETDSNKDSMELADDTNEIMAEIEVTLIFNLRSSRRLFVDVRYNLKNFST